ncbi:bifunctional metallophosphatase/5'-nucleotidase [Alishewanella sp. d11]|uniref:bifunctional metallophosphatase/5'-nucleotidase n=1 Tax=Alishewanella sp. d11 TaxID=3414030 RepID=UPI003BF8DA27
MNLCRTLFALSFTSVLVACSLPNSAQSDRVSEPELTQAALPSAGLQLKIIHINDTHSQFDPSPAKFNAASGQPVYTFIGGHPRLLTEARRLRENAAAAGLPSLFLHGGDAFKGSAYFELFEQKINIDILNRMQLDAMALGNHEFDIGLAKLANFAEEINFPLLAANVDKSAEPLLAQVKNLKPYQIFVLNDNQWVPEQQWLAAQQAEQQMPSSQRQALLTSSAAVPVRIAVFGLALEDMRAMVPSTGALVFEREITAAQRTVDYLTQQGIQHIVALTHLGNQRDLRLAAAVNGIDVIVGGHSHTLLGDFRQWHLGLQGPYAERVTNPDGQQFTCVVQAGQFAQAVGALTVKFDKQGQVSECQGKNTLLASKALFGNALRQADSQLSGNSLTATLAYLQSLPNTRITEEDTTLRQVIDEVYLPALQQAYGEQISSTEQTIPHVRLPGTGGSDQHGSVLAGHIADAMYNWLNSAQVQPLLAGPVDFSLIGAGNIRSSIEAGAIYEGHIRLEVLPFDAPLSVLTVTGADVLALLEATIAATLPEGAHAGKFPYSSHLRYTATERLDGSLQLTEVAMLREGNWQAIVPEQQYRLATTNYLANGNDGWQRLQQVQQHSTDRQDLILLNGQPKAYAVKRVLASSDAKGQTAFQVEYAKEALPCGNDGADCKTAAQAMIEYLRANPELWHRARTPTVTLYRN